MKIEATMLFSNGLRGTIESEISDVFRSEVEAIEAQGWSFEVEDHWGDQITTKVIDEGGDIIVEDTTAKITASVARISMMTVIRRAAKLAREDDGE